VQSPHGHEAHPSAKWNETQSPPAHTFPASHASQPPQWSASEDVSTHPPPQFCVPPLHALTHVPFWQRGVPPPHGPLPPQSSGFESGSTQLCPEGTRPGRHVQLVPTHHSASSHAFVQLPHWFGSSTTFVHPGQHASPAAQGSQAARLQPYAGSSSAAHTSPQVFASGPHPPVPVDVELVVTVVAVLAVMFVEVVAAPPPAPNW
jgi:hypothetical protein